MIKNDEPMLDLEDQEIMMNMNEQELSNYYLEGASAEQSLNFCQVYPGIDEEKHCAIIAKYGTPEQCLRCVQVMKNADIEALYNNILKHEDLPILLEFIKFCKVSDIQPAEKLIIESKKANYCYYLAKLKNKYMLDMDKLGAVILTYDDNRYTEDFLKLNSPENSTPYIEEALKRNDARIIGKIISLFPDIDKKTADDLIAQSYSIFNSALLTNDKLLNRLDIKDLYENAKKYENDYLIKDMKNIFNEKLNDKTEKKQDLSF